MTAPTDLVVIDTLAKKYADARGTLSARVEALEAEIEAIRRKHLPGIKTAVGVAALRQSELKLAIGEAPHLFVKPRTFTCHGVKVGYQKGKGRLTWDDDAKVVALIRKHLPEQAEVLIVSTEEPSRKALANVEAAMLRKIGVQLVAASDAIVIEDATSEVDKLVAKLLEEGAKAAEEDAA